MKPPVGAMVAMAAIVTAANVLVQFHLGNWLTWGALVYPFAFMVTDVVTRVHGPARARQVLAVGFAAGLACSLAGTQIHITLPDGTLMPAVTLRIALASGLAFLLAQLLDVAIFVRLSRGAWWRAPLISSVLGSLLDTLLFFFMAFSSALVFLEPHNDVSFMNEALPLPGGGEAEVPRWLLFAAADWCVKIMVALVALIPFRLLVQALGPRAAVRQSLVAGEPR